MKHSEPYWVAKAAFTLRSARPLAVCPPVGRAMLGLVLLLTFLAGCKPKADSDSLAPEAAMPPPGGPSARGNSSTNDYFKTSFQTESQYIIESIISDLAEQMYYAAHHQLPDSGYFAVTATEKPNSPPDAPVYDVRIRLDSPTNRLDLELNVNAPIWSPAVYAPVGTALAGAMGLTPSAVSSPDDTKRLTKLLDSTPETIVSEDQTLSTALAGDFTNADLHEQAALLLGAFVFRDHSQYFFDLRQPLNRLTAHLAMAHFLRGGGDYGINGRLAEAFSLTLSGNEVAALARLDALATNDPAVTAMARALRAYNTEDYRPLNTADGLSPMECVQWFCALAHSAGVPVAWSKLSEAQKRNIDFVRLANQSGRTVEIGHQLLAEAIPLEVQEIKSVYSQITSRTLADRQLPRALNALPEHAFITGTNGSVQVRVIGWGQWAVFLQRQLCNAIQQNYYFLQYYWGVPDEAKVFADNSADSYAGLRLYPFVRRIICSQEADYHLAQDQGWSVTVAAPQLVPAECWNFLGYSVKFAASYRPHPNLHLSEWFNHNPPPGTVYDIFARLDHHSLVDRPDLPAVLARLHTQAPCNELILNYLLQHQYNGKPTHAQVLALYSSLLPYHTEALWTVAQTIRDQPDQYENLLLQAADINPVFNYRLSEYFNQTTNQDKASAYMEKACDADLDSVRVANNATWRVEYFIQKGNLERARQIADEAGEVYSELGLEAKAAFFELTSNYDGAFEWYAKVEERYNDSGPLLKFCLNYQSATRDARFRPEVEKRVAKLFPDGQEQVSLADFHRPPADGMLVGKPYNPLLSTGLNEGDVVVAIYGTRIHNPNQYEYVRDATTNPELDLIFWRTNAYHELKITPPKRRFGAPIYQYQGTP